MEGLSTLDNNSIGRRRKKLTAREKWQVYQETSANGSPIGEILRRHGLYSSELTKIRKQVEEGALKELGRRRYSKKPESVPYEEYTRLKEDLSNKEKAPCPDERGIPDFKKRTD